ncbi:MAG: hypothetical protein Q4F07_09900 [Bacteroidales bacterium]|nr:hypothetical protein [Bacteroidales bacterium]
MSASAENITADALIAAERAERYRIQLERPATFPTEQNWEYIINSRMEAIAPQLYRKYLLSYLTDKELRTDFHQLTLTKFPEYIKAIDRERAVDTIYSDILSAPDATISLIIDCRLFDADKLLSILNNDKAETDPAPFVAECMAAYQPEYNDSDLRVMKQLYISMRSLPPIGEIKESRGIFGRENKYICPHGHINNADNEYCDTCGTNIYGFTEKQEATITSFKSRINALEKLLSNCNRS